MNYKQFYFLFSLFFTLGFIQINAQDLWQKKDIETYFLQKKPLKTFKNFPEKYRIYSLNVKVLENQLKGKTKTIQLPNGSGILETFVIKETSNFSNKLVAKFPKIKSYTAKSIENPTAFAKISVGTDGFHAVIFSSNGKTVYIDPYTKNNKDFIVYKTSDLKSEDEVFKCEVEGFAKNQELPSFSSKVVSDGNLRTYRLAITCSGEYAQFHLNNQGIAASATESVKKAAVLSAMNTSMTRVNGIFEKDLAVTMQFVDDNDKIIFLDADTDNITDGDPNAMLDEAQLIIDTAIGDANYDIGHIFSVAGDGLAGLGVVCLSNQKAKGVTGRSAPIGDPYDIDFVAHEFGHQFGATHTQNNDCQRTQISAVEAGSGSTIMGYAGICSPNVQGQSDDYFHAFSISQIQNIIQSSGSCATLTANGNSAPVANAGLDVSIPKSTPFVLTATATDADGLSALTYNWEQVDIEIGLMPPQSTNSVGPMFRSLPSKTDPKRYFPEFSNVVANETSTWEVLPDVERSLNFSLLVRDNDINGGATSRDNILVSVVDAIPFEVTSQTTAEIWDAGATETVTWSKGTSDIAPINCKTVNIRLSTDGGLTFPFLLKENTPNDGTEIINIPNNITTSARILIEAADNIFYNINSTNFTIRSTAPSFILSNTSGNLAACNSGNATTAYTLNLDFINNFTETVTLSATGNPAGSQVSFNPVSLSADGNTVMTITNTDNVAAGDYIINVLGSSTTVNQNLEINFSITASNLNPVQLLSPTNALQDVLLTDVLTWQADVNAFVYDVQVAADRSFTNIILEEEVSETFLPLSNLRGETTYFWRVKAKNTCNEGDFSNVFSFITERPSYCPSTFTDEAGGSEFISNVTFNTINNNSSNDLIDGYEDFTSINTDVFRDIAYEISVTFDTAGFQDHCYVFIDWNQDYVFDKDTERYALGTETDDIATTTFNIRVPADAKMGKTTMRVIIEYDDPTDGFGDGPCDIDHLTEWGETEDYSITVTEPTIDPNNVSVSTASETCVNEGDGEITVKFVKEAFNYTVVISGDNTDLRGDVTNLSSTSFSNLLPGFYRVCVTTKELDFTQCFEIEIVASNTIALKTEVTNEKKYKISMESGTAPFSVFLNEKLLLTTSEKTFEFTPRVGGKLEVKSAKACEGSFKTSIETVVLLKNPVVNSIDLLLPLELDNNRVKATIFDVKGKLILNRWISTNNNTMSIPFQDFSKGLYILKLSIANNPIKIIKQ
ncbi:reprolysin-like metallopeptidase [uncultured Polaribacter sp.]|uniref:reprolysin-like metallopeptidase n=1 Tax=uncultured Polaribacter sp. TaxID=174711 RepID=UPI002618692F|nr:zinc-dependent metalloprotease family protein [uncultured Polaribacter sp.]